MSGMVDFICMGFLLLQRAEARFTKRKIRLTNSGTQTHDLWIVKPSPYPLGHGDLTVDVLKLN